MKYYKYSPIFPANVLPEHVGWYCSTDEYRLADLHAEGIDTEDVFSTDWWYWDGYAWKTTSPATEGSCERLAAKPWFGVRK